MLAQTKRTTSISFSARLPRGLTDAPYAPVSVARELSRAASMPAGTRDLVLVGMVSLIGLLVSLTALPADLSWMP